MEKITRLNWFKKVFGGVAALCAITLFGGAKPARKLGDELLNDADLEAAVKLYVSREKYLRNELIVFRDMRLNLNLQRQLEQKNGSV